MDDDESVCRALCRLLRAASYDSECFHSGRAFLDSLNDRQPDCLVLDLHMPDMSGLDLQRQLGLVGVRFPVVIITGHDKPGSSQQCLAAGAAAFLRKPLDRPTLLAAIDQALDAASSAT